MKKRVISCSVSVVLMLGIVGGFFTWVIGATTYHVEAYRPQDVVRAGNEAALRSRLFPCEFEHATVFLEWFTYDNDEINAAPYKLFIVVEPKSPNLRSVSVVEVSIKSTLGQEYDFEPATVWPTVLETTREQTRVSHKFEPGFMFRFDRKEQISTQIEIEIRTREGIYSKVIETQWVPVRVKMKAPIVRNANKTQHHKSDRAGELEIDWRKERGRSSESALRRSDWVC